MAELHGHHTLCMQAPIADEGANQDRILHCTLNKSEGLHWTEGDLKSANVTVVDDKESLIPSIFEICYKCDTPVCRTPGIITWNYFHIVSISFNKFGLFGHMIDPSASDCLQWYKMDQYSWNKDESCVFLRKHPKPKFYGRNHLIT